MTNLLEQVDLNTIFKQAWEQGRVFGQYAMTDEMRVLFCALITAHNKNDDSAFFATVEIVKTTLRARRNFSEDEWHIFRYPVKAKYGIEKEIKPG